MTIISNKACEVLTCTILCGLSELDNVNGFKDLERQKNYVKVEEN